MDSRVRSTSVPGRQGEQGAGLGSWAKERCVGLTLGLFAEPLLASRGQDPVGIVKST